MMRNVLWCTVLAVALVATGTALAQDPCLNCTRDALLGDAWCEDFEENSGPEPQCYETNGCTEQPEITMGCNNNYGWWIPDVGPDPTVLGQITCEQNHTEGGEQSLALDADDDTIHFLGDGYDLATSEFWVLTEWVYVPCNMAGEAFWIVNGNYELDGNAGNTSWGIQVRMNAGTGVVTDDCGGSATRDLVCNQWVELRAEINLAADKVRLFYDGEFLSQYTWTVTPGCGNPNLLQIRNMDWFNFGGTRYYFDDSSLCASEVSPFLPPVLQCRAIERLDSGCADYWWSFNNVNDFDDITEFWIHVEAGDGAQICFGEEDMTPPPTWSVALCGGGYDSNGRALFHFSGGDVIEPGRTVNGRLRVDPNGASPTTNPETLVEVPAFSVVLNAAQTGGNPDAECDADIFCPTCENPVACQTNEDCEGFGVNCVDGFCEDVRVFSKWSSPASVCTAFLAVPAMTTWAKAALVTLLVAGGALLVLRSRRPVTA